MSTSLDQLNTLPDRLKQRLPADEKFTSLVDEETLQKIHNAVQLEPDPTRPAGYWGRQPLAVSEPFMTQDKWGDNEPAVKLKFHPLFCAEPVVMVESSMWIGKGWGATRVDVARELAMTEYVSSTYGEREEKGDIDLLEKCKIKWIEFCIRKCECGKFYATYRNATASNFRENCCIPCTQAKYKERKRLAQQPYNAARSEQAAEARADKTCSQCGKPLEAQSAKKTYCSGACRQKAFRRNQRDKVHELQDRYDRVMALLNAQDQADKSES